MVGTLAGGFVAVDGVAFDDATHAGPREVRYTGPEQFRAVSGRPYVQGPVTWECAWEAMTTDAFLALYTIWNLKLNTNTGPRVTLTLSDPRNGGTTQSYDCWMDEPQFAMVDLYVRKVVARFVSVIG